MNLMFWESTGSQKILDGKYADVDRGIAWGESELAGTLVGRPLSSAATATGVDAAYMTENLRSEAHLYARDPREIKDMLSKSVSSKILQLPGVWDALTPPGSLPRSVVLSANRFTETKKRHLSTNDFFDDDTPIGPAASPPEGSIKAVRVYNHGACSAETHTAPGDGTGLLDEVSEAVWKEFVKKVIVPNGDKCITDRYPFRLEAHAMNFLDHVPRETRDLRGGFFLNAYYYVDVIGANVDVKFAASYQYTLVDGILGLNNLQTSEHTIGPEGSGAELTKSLIVTVPSSFAEMAKSKQTVNILKDYPGVTACDPTGSYQCQGAAGFAGAAAKNGAGTLEALGEESFSPDDRIALGDAMIRRVGDANSPLKDWVCVPDGSEVGGHCEFTVPAKRLNVYPDAVELVWFDGKEVKNPAYAVYVMAHYSEKNDATGTPIFDQESVNKLCSFNLPAVAPPREFAVSALPFTDADYLKAELCSGLGTGTSCSFGQPPRSSGGWSALVGFGLALALARRKRRTEERPS